jgi:hypothetical protein
MALKPFKDAMSRIAEVFGSMATIKPYSTFRAATNLSRIFK